MTTETPKPNPADALNTTLARTEKARGIFRKYERAMANIGFAALTEKEIEDLRKKTLDDLRKIKG